MKIHLPNGDQQYVDELVGVIAREDGIVIEFELPEVNAVRAVLVKPTPSLREAQKLLAHVLQKIDPSVRVTPAPEFHADDAIELPKTMNL